MQHVIPALQERNFVETTVCMQDVAPPQVSYQVQRLFRETFTHECIVSRSFSNP